MAKVLITEDYLSDIGDAIRGKLGGSTQYTPGQMASAINSIPTVAPTLISKSVVANGTYNASSDEADGYDSVSVNVPNTYSAQDEGKVVSSGSLVAQESQNISQNGTYDTTLKNQVVVDVPNSYAAADEGKVVSQGSLVTQTSKNITENGTHDTTTNNEVVVNVSATPVLYKFIDPDYVMDETGIICTLASRTYTKIYSDPALVAYYYNGAYTGPILLSKTENGVKYSAIGGTSISSIITIDSEQWYVSSDLYSMSGNLSKTEGFAQKLSGTYSTVDAAAEALYLISHTAINANGSYNVPSGYDGFDDFVVAVPNTYTQSDEGKVVSNGSLVSQRSRTITENGTFDTTLISELIANISGGGGGSTNILSGTDIPTSEIGSDGTIYLKHTSTQPVTNLLASFQDIDDWTKNQAAFTIHNVVYENGESELTHKGGNGYERIFVPVDVDQNTDYTFVIEFYPKTSVPNGYGGNSLAISVAKDDQTTTGSSGSYSNFGKTNLNRSAALDYSTYYLNFNSGSYNRVYPVIDLNITDNTQNVLMFKNLYFVKGTYTGFPIVGEITNSYLKVNGVWQSLIGSAIDDVNTGGGGGNVFALLVVTLMEDVVPTVSDGSNTLVPIRHETSIFNKYYYVIPESKEYTVSVQGYSDKTIEADNFFQKYNANYTQIDEIGFISIEEGDSYSFSGRSGQRVLDDGLFVFTVAKHNSGYISPAFYTLHDYGAVENVISSTYKEKVTYTLSNPDDETETVTLYGYGSFNGGMANAYPVLTMQDGRTMTIPANNRFFAPYYVNNMNAYNNSPIELKRVFWNLLKATADAE